MFSNGGERVAGLHHVDRPICQPRGCPSRRGLSRNRYRTDAGERQRQKRGDRQPEDSNGDPPPPELSSTASTPSLSERSRFVATLPR